MRISMLEAREPFPRILERTLAGFLTERHGEPVAVHWHPGARARPARARTQLVCNGYLNAIFAPGADRSVLEPVLREYSRSPRPWLRPAQRLYVKLATAPATARRLAHALVEIQPALADVRRLLVMGGNTRIRVLEPAVGRSWLIRKDGFPANHLVVEAEGRRRAASAGVPTPRLLEAPSHRRWILEEYTPGTPLNRLPVGAQAAAALREVTEPLGRLHAATLRSADAAAYARSLADRAQRLVEASAWLDPAIAASLSAAAEASRRALAEGVDRAPFHLAFAHGDFHAGNILVTERGAVLIDWEHAGERQEGHDALVHALRARSPAGIGARVAGWVRGGGPGAAAGLPMPSSPATLRRRAAGLLLLETLVHYLEEHEPAPIRRAGPGLTALIAELAPWLAAAGAADPEGARAAV